MCSSDLVGNRLQRQARQVARHRLGLDATVALDADLADRLAEQAGLPVWRIDPLKTNVPAVTAIMSHEYAERHRILAVAVDQDSVTIGTDQPFYTDWLSNLSHTVQPRELRRVMLNPEQLSRYLGEFYQVTRAIAGASGNTGVNELSGKGVEALLQLGGRLQRQQAEADAFASLRCTDMRRFGA